MLDTAEFLVRDALAKATGFIPGENVGDAVFIVAVIVSDHVFDLVGRFG